MATSLTLENDSSLAQGYLKVNGSTAATLTTSGITGNVTGNLTGSLTAGGSLTLATAQTATGTSVDFTGIPSWAKRITVMFSGVSTSSTSNVQIQIGTGGTPKTSGYLGTVSYIAGLNTTNSALFTAGFGVTNPTFGNDVSHGQMFLALLDSATNKWVYSSSICRTDATVNFFGSGSVALSGILNIVRITTVNGTDTFDAGTINISYEG